VQDDRSNIVVFGYDCEKTKVLKAQLQSDELEVTSFTDPTQFSAALRSNNIDLAIILLKMPVTDCFVLIENTKTNYPYIPVLLMTQNVIMKIGQARKLNCNNKRILATVVRSEIEKKLSTEKCSKDPLTRTEKKVLSFLLDGSSNKEIARRLSRSVRTIEDHRAHIMRKLGVENIVDLVRAASSYDNIYEIKPAITLNPKRKKQTSSVMPISFMIFLLDFVRLTSMTALMLMAEL